MSKELVIGSNRHETKVAILEEDQLVEIYFQRGNEYSLAGSIHKGRVTRVLPGMQSAFVDLGLERDTFLYVSDFFEEENEDIDTVEERPARGERRERGGRPDQGDRRDAARPMAVETAPFILPEDEQQDEAGREEPPAISEVEDAGTADPITPSILKPTGENGEQTEGRGFRGGERRGRRSRRRRQSGGGFPENKYAQPGAEEPKTSAPSPVASSSPRVASVSPSVAEPGEVLLLPGESLAKYRNRSSGTNAASLETRDTQSAETLPGDLAPELTPEEEEAIASEAEEIALADKVFSHHDDLEPAEVEEQIASVQEDGAEYGEGEEGTPHHQDLTVSEPEDVDSPEYERISVFEERSEPDPLTFAHEPSDSPVPIPEPAGLDEFELAAIREALPEDEDTLEEGFTAPQGFSSTDDPEREGGPSGEAPVEQGSASPQNGDVQTASVREGGGRLLHRSSRRMRRRRGGNRSSQSPSESSTELRRGDTTLLTTVAGAAPAPEPVAQTRERSEERSIDRSERVYPSISDLLKPGQEIIVQIAKEPLGQKGARITSHIALPGRFVVFMPSVNHLGVSRKVGTEEERQRLKRILQTHREGTTGGFIVRTAGEGVPEDEIAADMNFLYTLWLDIRQKAEKKPAPALLHYDLDIVQRILRDQVTEDFKAVWVDNEDLYESVLTFMQRFQPTLVNRVKMYTRSAPIFDAFNITQELEKALRPKVWLKSGGYIVINQTEALVAIDINTGKYVGKSNRLEDTIVKTNLEAVKEIVRQIRLRDLGGIIVVDFIDMDERKNRQKVMQALEEVMRADKAPYKILQFNDFGLVAITRKRVKQSLERTLCSPCPYCEGAGYVKSVQTVISEILVEAQKIARAIEGKDVMLRVHPEVAKVLKASSNQYLEELEEILGRPVLVTGDPALHHQKFDLG